MAVDGASAMRLGILPKSFVRGHSLSSKQYNIIRNDQNNIRSILAMAGDWDKKRKGKAKSSAGKKASKLGTKEVPFESGKKPSEQDVFMVFTSSLMPEVVEECLQPEEPVLSPSWNTFASSCSGIWKGVSASFSPITGEFEPLGIGSERQLQFHAEVTAVSVTQQEEKSLFQTISWASKDALEEAKVTDIGLFVIEDNHATIEELDDGTAGVDVMGDNIQDSAPELPLETAENDQPLHEESEEESSAGHADSNELNTDVPVEASDDVVVEERILRCEPGLVFFEDGSYSSGPMDLLPVQNLLKSAGNGAMRNTYSAPPTFKIEHCIVRGAHTRVRLQQTISVDPEGEDLQCLRVSVFVEDWAGPQGFHSDKDGLKQRKPLMALPRTRPADVAGKWKKFEISATPLSSDGDRLARSLGSSHAFSCQETLVERGLPTAAAFQVHESGLSIEDISVVWLPAGLACTLHVSDSGLLTLGAAWLAEDGTRICIERVYDSEGSLFEVKLSSEVKGGWVGGRM